MKHCVMDEVILLNMSKIFSFLKTAVLTGSGISDFKECGETIAQGSCGGAIVSAANLDDGVQNGFEDSINEICYGTILLKPLLYQDDIFRAATSVTGAQDGLDRIWKIMGGKLLDIHTDKSCHIIVADRLKIDNILNEENEFNTDSFVVAVFPDHGSRYLSKIYSDEWMNNQGFYDSSFYQPKKNTINYI